MRSLIEALCSDACAGRRPGTAGGKAARALVVEALRGAGHDPFEQPVPGCGGANVLAQLPGSTDRWIVVAAHFDHLGAFGKNVYRGADDNAAAVGILVEVARALRDERDGRGVVFAAFDGEEPPFFLSGAMGSQHFVAKPTVPLASIDFMVCMDLVGHRLGPPGLPDEVGQSLFALGAERSAETLAMVRGLERSETGLVVRAADAEIIPPLSDYDPFWRASIPFLFLTAGRSAVYHTPNDTPDLLDHPKMEATARWLTDFVRRTRVRSPIRFEGGGRGDAATLDSVASLLAPLAPFSSDAAEAAAHAADLRRRCEGEALPDALRPALAELVAGIEARLA